MALKSGLAAQIGFAEETTVGTAATVTRFLPLVSEKMENKIQRIESKGIIPGRRVLDTTQWAAGRQTVAGTVQFELCDRDIGMLFKHAWGAVSSTGAGPYVHTFTPGDKQTAKALTCQIGRPGVGGTVHPFTYAGCKVNKMVISSKVGELATCSVDLVGMSETTGTALASASLSPPNPMVFTGATLTLGGSSFKVKESTYTLDCHLATDRFFNGQATTEEALEADLQDHMFNLSTEFTDLTQYTRFIAGTSAALVQTYTLGSYSLAITAVFTTTNSTP